MPEETTPHPCPDGCSGDRRGYQWHIRTKTPACSASKQAAADYSRDYYSRNGGWPARTRRQKLRARSRR